MATLTSLLPSVKSAPRSTRVLFDATTSSWAVPYFAAGLIEPDPSPPWTEGDEATLQACFDAVAPDSSPSSQSAVLEDWRVIVAFGDIRLKDMTPAQRQAREDAIESTRARVENRRRIARNWVLEGLVWDPRPAGYDAQDAADFAAGRLLTPDQLAEREEIEEEARLLANQPAHACEEALFRFEA